MTKLGVNQINSSDKRWDGYQGGDDFALQYCLIKSDSMISFNGVPARVVIWSVFASIKPEL